LNKNLSRGCSMGRGLAPSPFKGEVFSK